MMSIPCRNSQEWTIPALAVDILFKSVTRATAVARWTGRLGNASNMGSSTGDLCPLALWLLNFSVGEFLPLCDHRLYSERVVSRLKAPSSVDENGFCSLT